MNRERKLNTGANKLRPGKRYVRFDAGTDEAEGAVGVVDKETRCVTFSFSSEEPCASWYGDEILSHAPGCARLERMNAGGSLLFNHNMDDLLGVVEKAWIGNDRRGYCTVRFATDDRGEWAMARVDEKVLQSVSLKYRIHTFETEVDSDTYTATDWEVLEISLVTVPADASVGIGRSGTDDEMDVIVKRPQPQPAAADTNHESETMKIKHVLREAADVATSTGGGAGAAAAIATPADPVAAERQRSTEIDAMCKQHGIDENTRNALIAKGASIEEARGVVLDVHLQRSQSVASLGSSPNPELTEKEKARYSMFRAINATLGQNWKDAGFEREVSAEIAKRSGKSTNGFFLPTNIPFYDRLTAQRAFDYATSGGSSGGGNIVATNLLTGNFIDLLRNKVRVMQLGATMLSGLVGNVDIPKQTGAGSVYWVGEGVDLTQTGGIYGKVSLTPKHIGAFSLITRNMLQQSTPAIEMLARADLLSTVALGIDLAAISGTGSSGQPTGIVNQSGVGSVVGGTNGAALTIDHLIDLETAVTNANADEGAMAYLANSKSVGALKKLKSTTGQYLWTGLPGGGRSGTPGEINGYPVARSNQARSTLTKGSASGICSELIFGNWSDVLIGEWGVVEILPNQFAPAAYANGGIELRIMQTIDIGVRHAASFSVMSDALTT